MLRIASNPARVACGAFLSIIGVVAIGIANAGIDELQYLQDGELTSRIYSPVDWLTEEELESMDIDQLAEVVPKTETKLRIIGWTGATCWLGVFSTLILWRPQTIR